MRIPPRPTPERSSALEARLARLQQPAAVLEILGSSLQAGFAPARVRCSVQSIHSDRFVLRAQLRSESGVERAYALKSYAGDLGRRLWERSRALADRFESEHGEISLPSRYLPRERLLVFPWIDGRPLSEIADGRKPGLLQRAARLAADLHRSGPVPERPITARMMVHETLARCGQLRGGYPETAAIVEPLTAALRRCSNRLDPAPPAPVHGDLAAGQFLWTGDRLVLLDLDRFGYSDPAYDAGHFLAQLERRCLSDGAPPELASGWLDCFRDAYRAAMPAVAPRHLAFYRGLTLIRKLATVSRRPPAGWTALVPQLAARARAALEEAA